MIQASLRVTFATDHSPRRDYSIWRGEVCSAYTSILVNLWYPNEALRYLYEIFPVNPSLLYQAVGTQANVAKISFKLCDISRLLSHGIVFLVFLAKPKKRNVKNITTLQPSQVSFQTLRKYLRSQAELCGYLTLPRYHTERYLQV